jgi:hypothetical protein
VREFGAIIIKSALPYLRTLRNTVPIGNWERSGFWNDGGSRVSFMALVYLLYRNVKPFSGDFESSKILVCGNASLQTIPTIVGHIEARDNLIFRLRIAVADKIRLADHQDITPNLDNRAVCKVLNLRLGRGSRLQSDLDHALIIPNFRRCQPASDLFSILS